jgi:uncharacterized protein
MEPTCQPIRLGATGLVGRLNCGHLTGLDVPQRFRMERQASHAANSACERSNRMSRHLVAIALWMAATVLSVAGLSTVATAVSFDCSKASIRAEYLVCGNRDLSELDDRMAAAYSAGRHQNGNQAQLVLDQRAWLAQRNQCRDATCVARLYQARLAVLGGSPARSDSRPAPIGGLEVELLSQGGVLTVPVSINNRITLAFIIDSGAADVSVPADVVMTLIRTGSITNDDFLGKRTYTLADGTSVPSDTFRIRSLKVGNVVLENVMGSVASVNADLLLGQSFLSRFRSWSINNERRVLILE